VGPMRQGQVLVRDVVFRNLGSGVLCVSAPHAACGCVRATIEGDRRMEPAESRTVKVTVDIGSRQGKQDKEVRFHTNDPTRKVATFRVIADVRLGVILLDPVVEFRMTKGRPGTAVARLKSPKDERPWEVLSVEGAEAKYEFDVEEVPSTEPDFRLVNVRLTHPGSDVQGAQADKVKIRTSHPDHAEMLLTASVRVLDRYFAAPTSVPFGGLPADREGEWFDVRLLPADPTRPVPFAGARVEGKGFEVGKSAPAGSGEWIVAVRPNTRGLSPGTAQATLVVSFDDPEFPQTRVGLTVRVIDPARRAGGVPSGTAYGRR
jgi:hypothetical protein